jgi:hypothetical protein
MRRHSLVGMDPKRDMDDPVNIDLDPEDALRVLLGVDEDGDGEPDDE